MMKYTPFQRIVASELERIKSITPLQQQATTLPYHLALSPNRYTMNVLGMSTRRTILSRLFS